MKKSIDELVKRFESDIPSNGPIFINENGLFLNTCNEFKDHKDLYFNLIQKYIPATNKHATDYLVNVLNYVRLRNSKYLTFVDVSVNVTEQQLEALQLWFETKVNSEKIDINIGDLHKSYYVSELNSKELLNIIRKFKN